jgi:hypothetical protein
MYNPGNMRAASPPGLGNKMLLGAIGTTALAGLYTLGISAPLIRAQSDSPNWEEAAGRKMSFEVASVKQNTSGVERGYSNVPLNPEEEVYFPTEASSRQYISHCLSTSHLHTS